MTINPCAEWLETDGLGGFASGTVSGERTRRYHALLLTATTPPTGRFVLVNGFDAWIESGNETFAISSQRYTPDVVHPDGDHRLEAFKAEPWPTWTYRLPNGIRVEQELFVPHEKAAVVIRWRLVEGNGPIRLCVRPFFSGRDYHSLHHENDGFRFEPEGEGERRVWHPYPGVPAIVSRSNGQYHHEPAWYRSFLCAEERNRGLDAVEDLASPGFFRWSLSEKEAVWLLSADGVPGALSGSNPPIENLVEDLRHAELLRRKRFETPLHRAADAYLVRRGQGKTIIAGYPWFTDWGRDTFIALRGLCIATDRLDDAQQILTDWAGVVSEGMLPNLFPDHGQHPEYNSVDASLWYVIAVHDFLQATGRNVAPGVRKKLYDAVEAILTGYSQATRFGIRLDGDGLLAAGVPGIQLTWMDAKVGDWVVTPRIGKPVEIQALWLNALWIASSWSPRWKTVADKGRRSFEERFWIESAGHLHDVVDCEHRTGVVDSAFRPNQIFAVGGLPLPLLNGDKAKRVVDAVDARLWTPMGLRSLAPDMPNYAGRYEGGVAQRDGSYHQGTVWPWLIGPFVEAWVRVRGNTEQAKKEARRRFFEPLFEHVHHTGLGHVSESADGDTPHTPRGCPFQAWSLGELLRLEKFLATPAVRSPRKSRPGVVTVG